MTAEGMALWEAQLWAWFLGYVGPMAGQVADLVVAMAEKEGRHAPLAILAGVADPCDLDDGPALWRAFKPLPVLIRHQTRRCAAAALNLLPLEGGEPPTWADYDSGADALGLMAGSEAPTVEAAFAAAVGPRPWPWHLCAYGGHGVDIRLANTGSNGGRVWWSQRDGHSHNSYVCVADSERGDWRTPDGRQVSLVSVNGCGEIRWHEQAPRYVGGSVNGGNERAHDAFGLVPWKELAP